MSHAGTLTAAHWIYLLGVLAIIVTMVRRVNVVLPAMIATFLTAYAFSGKPTLALESVFMGSLVAGKELFNIFLVIAMMTALLNSLTRISADTAMIRPFRVIMRNGHLAYLVLGVATYVVSLFFWPTPTVPLMAGILLPAAIAAGLPPIGGALCIAVAGLGTALSSDYILKVAPGISANAAGVPLMAVADKALVLSLITGGIAFVLCYLSIRKDIRAPSNAHLEQWEQAEVAPSAEGGGAAAPARAKSPMAVARLDLSPAKRKWSRLVAVITPVAFLAIVVDMLLPKLVPGFQAPQGSAAAALVGGVAGLLMLAVAVIGDGRQAFRSVAVHFTEGLVFAFRAMAQVLPIAGFFFIGVATLAGPILGVGAGQKAPGFLFELVRAADFWIPRNRVFVTFGVLISGMVTGIDGSGFAGLPLTGAISGALGRAVNLDVSTLAAVGQMGSVWTGKTLTAWSALAAVAAFARVSVFDAVRKLFLPVVCGLFVATVFAIVVW
ncbi:MAG: hypothetical protein P4L36_20425 [Holophaga sp.]|nr:hypothetical protein [Holophaga sp.]